MSDRCDWDKLNGFDWIRLLCVRPQFSSQVSLEQLGNVKSVLWQKTDVRWFEVVWRWFEEECPEYAGYHRPDYEEITRRRAERKKMREDPDYYKSVEIGFVEPEGFVFEYLPRGDSRVRAKTLDEDASINPPCLVQWAIECLRPDESLKKMFHEIFPDSNECSYDEATDSDDVFADCEGCLPALNLSVAVERT